MRQLFLENSSEIESSLNQKTESKNLEKKIPIRDKFSQHKICQVHEIIRQKKTLTEAVKELGGSYAKQLRDFLAEFLVHGKPLTFDVFKALSIDEANGIWGERYFDYMQPQPIHLNEYTIEYIYESVLHTSSPEEAARRLHVDLSEFIYTQLFTPDDKPLTFEFYKNISIQDMKNLWGNDYQKPLKDSKRIRFKNPLIDNDTLFDKREKLFKSIPLTPREVLKDETSLANSEKSNLSSPNLNTSYPSIDIIDNPQVFNRYIFSNEELSFNEHSDLNKKTKFKISKQKRSKLSQQTVKHIHDIIFNSKDLQEAVIKLGISLNVQLKKHLAQFIVNIRGEKEPLNYQLFKALYPQQVQNMWNEGYDQPMQAVFDPSQYTFKSIHKIILEIKEINRVATNLGLYRYQLEEFFKNFIIKIKGKERPLTFEIFNSLSVEKAQKIWGEDYNKPIKIPINIGDLYTIKYIHSVILKEENIKKAAAELKIDDSQLRGYLAQFIVTINENEEVLTFELFRALSVEEAQNLWGEYYAKTMTDWKKSTFKATLAAAISLCKKRPILYAEQSDFLKKPIGENFVPEKLELPEKENPSVSTKKIKISDNLSSSTGQLNHTHQINDKYEEEFEKQIGNADFFTSSPLLMNGFFSRSNVDSMENFKKEIEATESLRSPVQIKSIFNNKNEKHTDTILDTLEKNMFEELESLFSFSSSKGKN